MAKQTLMSKEQLDRTLAGMKARGEIKDYRHCETLDCFLVEPIVRTPVSDQMRTAAGYCRKEDVWGLK